MSPQFSVVIPAYNSKTTIIQTLRSVLAQTYLPLEVIIIDDGSTDGTEQAVQGEFPQLESGTPPIVYLRQPNAGVSRARNRGVAAARGNWIAFLDSDDEWMAEKLAIQAEAIRRSPEVALVACGFLAYEADGRSFERRMPDSLTKSELYQRLGTETFILLSSTALKKEVFLAAGGFNEKLTCGEDRELWARIAIRWDIVLLSDVLVRKREQPDSISSNTDNILKDCFAVNSLVHNVLRNQYDSAVLRHFGIPRANSSTLLSVALLYASRGMRMQALKYWIQAVLWWPVAGMTVMRRRVGVLVRLAKVP